MNQFSTVSVVVPNYNYGRFIGEALKSVLAQTYPVHEIIIVDDGSTDDSVEIIKHFGDKARLINQANQGVGAARNKGIENSSGEFIAFLDADDIWMPTKIQDQMERFADKEVGLVSCGVREFDTQTGETIEIHLSDITEWSVETILLRQHKISVGGSSIIVRRRVFEKVSGFNEQLQIAEDWDFCYRVVRQWKIASVPKALVNYRNHGGNVHLGVSKMEYFMFSAYENIFSQADEETLQLQSASYGNLHKILAGAYFQSGSYKAFLNHTVKALWYEPRQLAYYLRFPARYFKRRIYARHK